MLDKIYYDTFKNEYCLPTENDFGVAPPERYIATYRGYDPELYIEYWAVESDKGDKLAIAIPKTDYRKTDIHDQILQAQEVNHNCKLRRLLYWTIPPKEFDDFCKRFDLNK